MNKINLIANVVFSNSKLIVGQNNTLVAQIKQDLEFFKTKTMGSIVVMGRKTWFSIPASRRPLIGRTNVIITNNPDLLPVKFEYVLKNRGKHFKDWIYRRVKKQILFMTLSQFEKWILKQAGQQVFIIGGGELYNTFLQTENPNLKPHILYITEVKLKEGIKNSQNTSVIDYIPKEYSIVNISEKYETEKHFFRFLTYNLTNTNQEHVYLNLLSDVYSNGSGRIDRTSTGTISVFGRQTRIDISKSIPVLTTKRIPWKSCIEELLWFLRGDTCSKILEKKGVNIWKSNTSREFLDSVGLNHYPEGILGKGYGWQWRFSGAKYSFNFADTSKIDTKLLGGVDQIEDILHLLKTDPFSRRIILCTWNPPDLKEMALSPCHVLFQFYVEQDLSGTKWLSCHYFMRSNDLFLGAPWNIMSYAVLTHIFAMKTGMKPKELVYSCSDAHIYTTHFKQVQTQLERKIRSSPVLILDERVKDKNWKDLCIDDFDLIGYFPDKAINGVMAV